MFRNSRSVKSWQRQEPEGHPSSDFEISFESNKTSSHRFPEVDRLVRKRHSSDFDYLPYCEQDERDPFCQGLKLVLSYRGPEFRRNSHHVSEPFGIYGIKLRQKIEQPCRSFESVIEQSFVLSPLSKDMKYFQHRQISWLKSESYGGGFFSCGGEVSKAKPAIFFWEEAIVYIHGSIKEFKPTNFNDISSVEFHLPNICMIGQESGGFNLLDFHKGIVYRSIEPEKMTRLFQRPNPVKDVTSYSSFQHPNLAFAIYGSDLRALDLSQKNATCCEYTPPCISFYPNKAKVLERTKVAMYGTDSTQIVVWDVRNPSQPYASPQFFTEIDIMDNDPCDPNVIVFSSYGTVFVYNFGTENLQDRMDFSGFILGLTWHIDGRISVLVSDSNTALYLLKVDTQGKLQIEEEIRTSIPNRTSSNLLATEGCKQSTQYVMLGNLNFYRPSRPSPNFSILKF